MSPDVLYAPMVEQDIHELEQVLLNDSVYKYIGGTPGHAEFRRWLLHAIEGPPASRSNEQWLNYTVRMRTSGRVIGRLEATIHDGLAEVAYLYAPTHWGNGFAKHGLLWLHDRLRSVPGTKTFWACTVPGNARSTALLAKCGYTQVLLPGARVPRLRSFDPGDHVYVRPSEA